MIKIKAKLKLYKGSDKRQTPFYSGYRPLFNFIEETKTSGQITLLDKEEFKPGEEGIVEIAFLHEKYLGDDFKAGRKFLFDEGSISLGEGEIIEIL